MPRRQFWLAGFVFLLEAAVLPPARAQDRALAVVFGPAAEETATLAARFAAAAAIEWLKSPGASLELRRPGIPDGQELTRHISPADVERAFLDAARSARDSDLMGFLKDVDRAVYGLARRPGKRLLIVVLESRLAATLPMKGGPEEADNRLNQTADFCKSKSVSVVVLDPSDASTDSAPGLKALAGAGGGALVRDPRTLEAAVRAAAPAEKALAEREAAKPAAAVAEPAGPAVHTRYIRTYPMRVKPGSDLGPMNGLLLVQAPLDTLEFQAMDQPGTYLARARLTQIVRNAEGKAVWQARKEVTLKGPLRKLQARRSGNLTYLRELKLPGGSYMLEAIVEDLVANKSGKVTESLRASDSLPGFAVSDALFIRTLDNSVDRMEADQVLSYDGRAIAPLLDPVFPANQPCGLELYFIIYPDLRGAQPKISLEIRRNGQPVGRSQLPFNDQIRNTATEGQAMDAKGEQKHEFPYLAKLLGATFEAGVYEAHVTIRQDSNTVTRVVPFRVLDTPGGR